MSLCFYTDTHIPKQVAIQLRNKGVEVIRCEEVGLAEVDDEIHLTYAAENQLVLVTKDIGFRLRHFQWLSQGKNHSGIFFFSDRQLAAIGQIVNACYAYYRLIEEGAGNLDHIQNQIFDMS